MSGSEGPLTDVFRFRSGRSAHSFIRLLGRGLEVRPEGPIPISVQHRVQEYGDPEVVVIVEASREELRNLHALADIPPEQKQNVCCIRTRRVSGSS